jgi:hypothetical protein
MSGPRSAKSSARSSVSAGRFRRLLGLDSRPRTVATLLPRSAAETLFPKVWGGFRCSACGSRQADVRPHWAARQAAGQITPPEGTI